MSNSNAARRQDPQPETKQEQPKPQEQPRQQEQPKEPAQAPEPVPTVVTPAAPVVVEP